MGKHRKFCRLHIDTTGKMGEAALQSSLRARSRSHYLPWEETAIEVLEEGRSKVQVRSKKT